MLEEPWARMSQQRTSNHACPSCDHHCLLSNAGLCRDWLFKECCADDPRQCRFGHDCHQDRSPSKGHCNIRAPKLLPIPWASAYPMSLPHCPTAGEGRGGVGGVGLLHWWIGRCKLKPCLARLHTTGLCKRAVNCSLATLCHGGPWNP